MKFLKRMLKVDDEFLSLYEQAMKCFDQKPLGKKVDAILCMREQVNHRIESLQIRRKCMNNKQKKQEGEYE